MSKPTPRYPHLYWIKEEAERLQERRNFLYNSYQDIVLYGLCGREDYDHFSLEWDDWTPKVLDLALKEWERRVPVKSENSDFRQQQR